VDNRADTSEAARWLHPVDARRLKRIAGRQLGLFTREQAHMCGFSPAQIRRRLAAGSWRAFRRDVFAQAGLRSTPLIEDRAAQLTVPGSVLAGFSAARVWDMPVPKIGSHLIVTGRTDSRPSGVRLIRADLSDRDLSMCQGGPVTSPPRTVFDCLRLLDDRPARDLLDRALQRRWITIGDLIERARAHTGRRGAPRLARLIGQAAGGTRSAAERRLAGLLRRSGLHGWQANIEIHDDRGLVGVGDVVFEQARVVIEVDGWAFHVTPDRFRRDRERQNRLVAAGWTVLRFTWRDLTERPTHVIRTVERLVRVA
jgi:very-short-patch-repair endonuclease